jgi:general secretion pathway protein K
MTNYNKRKKYQKGVALLTVLLISAIISAISIKMIANRQKQTLLTANRLIYQQAMAYAKGAESLAHMLLKKDHQMNKIDSKQDIWAQAASFDYPLPNDGFFSGKFDDLSAKINLNLLINKNGKTNPDIYTALNLLFDKLEIDKSIINAIQDRIDKDSDVTGIGGAESDYYLSLQNSYKNSNQLMLDISELLLVRGINKDIFNKMIEYVTVLPTDSLININTVTAEVLSVMLPMLKQEDIETIYNEIQEKPYENINQLKNHALLKNKNPQMKFFSVKSGYFKVNFTIFLDKIRLKRAIVLKRANNGETTTILTTSGDARL